MSWRGTSGHYKARWTGYRPDRRAGRDAVRPCPRITFIRPCQNTRETYGKCQGPGVWFGASLKTGQQEYVQVSDDEAHMGGPVYTFDIIRVVAMACMKLNDFSSQWWR
jgi:hypothetical protein